VEVVPCESLPDHDHLEITIDGEKKFYFHICRSGMTIYPYPSEKREQLAYVIGAGGDNADYKITDEVRVGLVKDQREGGVNAIQ